MSMDLFSRSAISRRIQSSPLSYDTNAATRSAAGSAGLASPAGSVATGCKPAHSPMSPSGWHASTAPTPTTVADAQNNATAATPYPRRNASRPAAAMRTMKTRRPGPEFTGMSARSKSPIGPPPPSVNSTSLERLATTVKPRRTLRRAIGTYPSTTSEPFSPTSIPTGQPLLSITPEADQEPPAQVCSRTSVTARLAGSTTIVTAISAPEN